MAKRFEDMTDAEQRSLYERERAKDRYLRATGEGVNPLNLPRKSGLLGIMNKKKPCGQCGRYDSQKCTCSYLSVYCINTPNKPNWILNEALV
jgi:hypothetical protein